MLSEDLQAFMLALEIGVVIGFVCGAVVLALALIRSPRRGLN